MQCGLFEADQSSRRYSPLVLCVRIRTAIGFLTAFLHLAARAHWQDRPGVWPLGRRSGVPLRRGHFRRVSLNPVATTEHRYQQRGYELTATENREPSRPIAKHVRQYPKKRRTKEASKRTKRVNSSDARCRGRTRQY